MTVYRSSLAAGEDPADKLPHNGGRVEREPSVLLVDDDEAFIGLVASYLESEHGFETRTLTRPTSALEYLEAEGEVDCIVSDYRMPEVDGLQFLEAVKAAYPEIPFVMFAGQGSEAVASRAIRSGADDYLQKDTGEAWYDLLATRIRNCVTIARQRRQLDDLYAAIEDAGHGILVTDHRGTITYVNPTMEALSGYDRDGLIGETPAQLQSGEHDEAFYRDLWETILSGDVWQGEVVNAREDGSHYVIDQTIAPITTTDGTVEGFVAINRDVTDQRTREREHRRFRQAVEHAGHAVLITDADGVIEYVNEAFEALTGYAASEVVGETPAILKSGEHDEAFYDRLWETIRAGEVWQGEIVNARKEGTTFTIDQTIAPITANGEIEGFVAINRDVTDQKARERELERFRSAVRYAGHGVVITDADGVIEYVNEAFEEMTGYAASEAIGETPAILKSGEHDEAFYRDLWRTITDGEVWQGEVVNARKDGRHYVIDQTIAPITANGEIEGFVAINRDVTRLKAYEEELENQNERLKQYGQTVAHDLRNPLTLLEGELENLSHLVSTDGEVDPENVLDRCGEMRSVIGRMRDLIDDLLTMAEQGQLVLDSERVGLESIAEDAWRQVESADAALTVEDTEVEADPDRLRELLSNLFRNAIEHAGADVHVRAGPLEMDDGFFVEDDGPGIPESDRDRVLDRGFTTDEEGTGFGLAIVEQIGGAHGWDLAVTDAASGGARFEFRVDDDRN